MGKRSLLRLTPFLAGCLVTLLSALLFYSFGYRKPQPLNALDNAIFDVMLRIRGPRPVTGAVAIVDIDERSLAEMGQWPWPRDVMAKLVTGIRDAGARVIAFDIVFAEGDRTAPSRLVERLCGDRPPDAPPCLPEEVSGALAHLVRDPALDPDTRFGDALAEAPSVLGYFFLRGEGEPPEEERRPFPAVSLRTDPAGLPLDSAALIPARRVTLNVEAISMAASEGFLNVFPDPAGTVRKVPLLMALGELPYPSLALEGARMFLGEEEARLHLSEVPHGRRRGTLGVSLGQRFFPTDALGQMAVNYRGPVYSFDYIPASEVLAGGAGTRLYDKLVLVGTSAAGLLDIKATPFSSVFPGVEIQATIADNLLAGDPMVHEIYTEIGITYALVVAGGLFLSALLSFSGPLTGAAWALLTVVATTFGNYHFLFLQNRLAGIGYALGFTFVLFLSVTLVNYLVEGRKKQFIRQAFGRYLAPAVVTRLIADPSALRLAGEEKTLSVMFCDIRGFTAMSEKLSPAELGRFMNRYFNAMGKAVMGHQGLVDKYIGDAIMALWGAPLNDPLHAKNAIRSALAMVEQLMALKKALGKEGFGGLDIGVGINTGLMNVGNFGSDQRFDYTVLGDSVNLASRTEGLTKQYGIRLAVTEFTRAAAGDGFYYRYIDRVRVKGKSDPVAIYEPMGEGTPPPALAEEIRRFEAATEAYRNRRFAEARKELEALHGENPAPLYEIYIERVDALEKSPPPETWDGVYSAPK